MSKSAKKSVDVIVPELADLPLDPATANELDQLCSQSRAIATQIKYLEDGDLEHGVVGSGWLRKRIREVVEGLGDMVPDRVLGEGWDLRRQVRVNERIDPAKLKLALLHAGLRIKVLCPKVVVRDDPNWQPVPGEIPVAPVIAEVCPLCSGTGERVLEGLDAAKAVVEQCTDRSESVSYPVYARSEKGE